MAYSKDRLQHYVAIFYAAIFKPALLLVACAFSLSACGDRSDTPSLPSTPKPQTKAERPIPTELKRAVFFYSVKPDKPYQVEHPAARAYVGVET